MTSKIKMRRAVFDINCSYVNRALSFNCGMRARLDVTRATFTRKIEHIPLTIRGSKARLTFRQVKNLGRNYKSRISDFCCNCLSPLSRFFFDIQSIFYSSFDIWVWATLGIRKHSFDTRMNVRTSIGLPVAFSRRRNAEVASSCFAHANDSVGREPWSEREFVAALCEKRSIPRSCAFSLVTLLCSTRVFRLGACSRIRCRRREIISLSRHVERY